MIYNKILKKEATVAVIGLGYVGLPIALAFAKKVKVIGFDINEKRVNMMKKGIDPSQELTKKDFAGSDISFTHPRRACQWLTPSRSSVVERWIGS